jgi:uncharacterized surface protein with fasciclin (FAS1) repeats
MPMNNPKMLALVRGGLCLAAAAVALAAASTAVRADSTTTTTTQVTTTTTLLPVIPTIDPAPVGPNGQPIDYTVLINSPFDYTDLNQAKAEGYSDSEIATMAKISVMAGVPFDDVVHQAQAGQTAPFIADKYNLRMYDVWDASDYQAKIAAYKLAYENTGANRVRSLVAAEQQEMVTTPYGSTVTTTETSGQNLADIINSAPDLTMFARALRTAHLTKELRGSGQYTVFAPTDSAWSKLTTDQVNGLFADRNALTKVINYCIIPRRVDSASIFAMGNPSSMTSLEGDSLSVSSIGSTAMVNGASVVKPDWFASNGIAHEIDTVLIPSGVNLVGSPATTTLAPSTTLSPGSTTNVSPNGTSTTITPNGTTTVEPNGTTTVSPSGAGSTTISPSPNGSTTVTPQPGP